MKSECYYSICACPSDDSKVAIRSGGVIEIPCKEASVVAFNVALREVLIEDEALREPALSISKIMKM